MSDFPLLSTKLTIPPRRPALVPRLRLQQKLDRVLAPGTRMAVLSAPAGFGKTTLVVDWLAASISPRGIPMAWLSLDESDNDFTRFLRYFIAAFQQIIPGIGMTTLALLEMSQKPSPESLTVSLINELAASTGLPKPSDALLVIDDMHVITDRDAQQALEFFIEHKPACMHLVLTTRRDPMLPLARLRARGELVELRAADLRFSQAEAENFFNTSAALELTPGQIEALEQRSEGWAAGLQMAAIALQSFLPDGRESFPSPKGDTRTMLDEFLRTFGGNQPFVFDYLAQEVLDRLEPGTQDFLRQTSVLARLSPELCSAVTGRQDSEALLKALEQSNLFIAPLDPSRQWYRYHGLFADFLCTTLAPDQRASLRRRAAEWCAAHGLLEEAISYALSAEDWAQALRYIDQEANRLFRSSQISTLVKYFEALPRSIALQDPDLCIYIGWASIMRHSADTAAALARQAETLLTETSPSGTHGRLLGLRAYLEDGQGRFTEAMQLGEQALQSLDPEDYFFRTVILTLISQVQRMSGSINASIRTCEETIQILQRMESARASSIPAHLKIDLAIVEANLAISLLVSGKRRKADAYLREVIQKYTGPDGREYPPALFIHLPWAPICYEGNQLDEALQHVQRGMELCEQMGIQSIVVGGRNTLCQVYFAQGNIEAALESVRKNRQEAQAMQLGWIAQGAAALEAYFELKRGNLPAARQWMDSVQLSVEPDPYQEDEYTLQARILIASGKLEQALALLDSLERLVRRLEHNATLISVDILFAITYKDLGNAEKAREYFEQAVRLASPESMLRPFLEDDTASLAQALLASMAGPADADVHTFLEQILLETPGHLAKPAASSPAALKSAATTPTGLVEPITPREREVLQLIAEGLSNADIARRLFLTINTLKAHTNSIYGKLDVHSRVQAVNRAQELGLLSKKD